jgi:hypothetical protein
MRIPRLGELRLRFLRVLQYAGAVSTVAIMLVTLKTYGFSGWLIVIIFPIFFGVFLFDHKYIIKPETDYQNQNNPALQKLLKDVAEIKEALRK